MIIRYKGIWHERYEDAPFIGAIVSAIDCKMNCIDCFNSHIKDMETKENSTLNIVSEIKNNKFNQGIILSGLEWSLQKKEMLSLIKYALNYNLEVIIYTGLSENKFLEICPEILFLPIYVKFGNYNKDFLDNNYFSYGVKLASKNQYIKKFGMEL